MSPCYNRPWKVTPAALAISMNHVDCLQVLLDHRGEGQSIIKTERSRHKLNLNILALRYGLTTSRDNADRFACWELLLPEEDGILMDLVKELFATIGELADQVENLSSDPKVERRRLASTTSFGIASVLLLLAGFFLYKIQRWNAKRHQADIEAQL